MSYESQFMHALIFACVGAAIATLICFIKKKKANSAIVRILFVAYISALMSLTVIPRFDLGFDRGTGKHYIDLYLEPGITSGIISVNLVPFKSILNYIIDLSGSIGQRTIAYVNILGNIIMFIPMGLLLRGIIRKPHKNVKVILISGISSCAIELAQLLVGRSFDIDDVILNLLGGSIGCLLGGLLEKIVLSLLENRDEKRKIVD